MASVAPPLLAADSLPQSECHLHIRSATMCFNRHAAPHRGASELHENDEVVGPRDAMQLMRWQWPSKQTQDAHAASRQNHVCDPALSWCPRI
jgi:hypothetical protein